MYPSKETEISYHYLQHVIAHLDKPICLLGGWAVYFTVNTRFEKEKGSSYLGSRDIDLGFSDTKTMKKAMERLEQLGFKRHSFRYFKELHTETMRELHPDEARHVPLHDIFPMYVDLITTKANETIKAELGFMPVDEPLLVPVFEQKKKKEMMVFGKQLLMPTPALLLAMKIKSVKERDKQHKRIKDFCDLTALCLYSGIPLDMLKREAYLFINEKHVETNLNALEQDDYIRVGQILNIDLSVLQDLVRRLTT